MAEKKQDFVVSDRRRFGSEGELRSDAPVSEEEEAQEQARAAAAPPPQAPPASTQQAQPPEAQPQSPAKPVKLPSRGQRWSPPPSSFRRRIARAADC